MSKLSELIKKYPEISRTTANKFSEGDNTNTKKYLEYMIKTWMTRNQSGGGPRYIVELIRAVNEFDSLLPYIKNKDIYSPQYNNFSELLNAIEIATEEKENKTFDKEKNVMVLEENDDYIFLIPKTHLGSCRYGSGTKWCTASKKDQGTFKRYTKNGLLGYLISKKEDKTKNNNKVAFYLAFNNSPITNDITIYNSIDQEITDNNFISSGWDSKLLLKLITIFRFRAMEAEKIAASKEYLDSITLTISNINILDVEKHVKIIEKWNSLDPDYFNNMKNTFDDFINKIKIF